MTIYTIHEGKDGRRTVRSCLGGRVNPLDEAIVLGMDKLQKEKSESQDSTEEKPPE